MGGLQACDLIVSTVKSISSVASVCYTPYKTSRLSTTVPVAGRGRIDIIANKTVNMVVKRGYIYHLMLLAALGAYVLDTVRDGIQYTTNATERMDTAV